MNRKQRIILSAAIIVVTVSFVVWIIYGGELFTKTQILVEQKDELFGWTEKKWVDKFVWGFDLTAAISGIALFSAGIFFMIFRNKRTEKL